MGGLLLALLVFPQGTSVPNNSVVSGVIRTAGGGPASGVRVAAALSAEAGNGASITLVRLIDTDDQGRFVLENVPPGRYYILAGRLDSPTFYPGTSEISKGTIVTIAPGIAKSGIDFKLAELSSGTPYVIQTNLTIHVAVEGEDKLPATLRSQSATFRLTPVAGGKELEARLDSTNITLPVASGMVGEYLVDVEKLPQGYFVKSMTYNGTGLTNATLKPSLEDLLAGSTPFPIATFGGAAELKMLSIAQCSV